MAKRNIVLMHNNTSLYNSLYDTISSKYNCIVLKPIVSDFKKIPDNIIVDLFIIDLKDLVKADILYLCDRLNTKRFALTPVLYTGSYVSNTVFASKVSQLRRTKYITSTDYGTMTDDIPMILGETSHLAAFDNNSITDNIPADAAGNPVTDTAAPQASDTQAAQSAVPKAAAASTKAPEAAAIPKMTTTTTVKTFPGKKTILVIDDDVNILTTVAKYLGREYTVISVRTTALAFMKIGVKKPDLILLDYMMPICNGMQTLEMIRRQFETSKIPVIMLTSFTEKEHVLQCFELGISGFLVKPVSKEDMLEAVHKVLS